MGGSLAGRLEEAGPAELAEAVRGIGEAFEPFATQIVSNGVAGADLCEDADDDEAIQDIMTNILLVTQSFHRRKLIREFRTLLAQQKMERLYLRCQPRDLCTDLDTCCMP